MFNLITVLCFIIIAIMVVLFIARARLVFRLRENYPRLHADVGSPIELSRGIGFLWRLERCEAQLSSGDLRLLKFCLALAYISVVAIMLFMILVFLWFPRTLGAGN